jgi:hypothetical protein
MKISKSAVSISFGIMAICVIIGILIGRRCASTHAIHTAVDTVSYVDTIKVIKPLPRDTLITRYETVRLPVVNGNNNGNNGGEDIPDFEDSVVENIPDSVNVLIPISQAVYQDSTYTAWISGYRITLDSIYVFSRREVVTIKKPSKRWHLGVSVGCGATPKGVQPWIGVGVTYSLFDF